MKKQKQKKMTRKPATKWRIIGRLGKAIDIFNKEPKRWLRTFYFPSSHTTVYAGGVKHRLFALPERLYSKRGEIRFGRARKAGSQDCKLASFSSLPR